jgi:hypothetical protein
VSGSSFGLISSLGAYNTNGVDLVSGSQNLSLIPLANVPLGSDKKTVFDRVRTMKEVAPPQRIIVCFSGDADRQAAIIFGGAGRQLAIDTAYDSDVPTECNS